MIEAATAKKWAGDGAFRREWDGFAPKGEGGVTYATVRYKANRGGRKPTQHGENLALSPKARRLTLDRGVIALSLEPPPPRDYVIAGLLVASRPVLLGGLGGVSKTQVAMQLAVCVAVGLDFAGLTVRSGCVLGLFGEEDAQEIARRVGAEALSLTAEQRATLQKRIRALGTIGEDTRLTYKQAGALEVSDVGDQLIEMAVELEQETGDPVRLIILDHAAMIHGGDFNVREDVAQTMREVNRIAQKTGAAVIVLAHSPKSAVGVERTTVADIAGNAAWVDLARGAWGLATMRDEEGKKYGIAPERRQSFVSLTVTKNNYGPTGGVIWFERCPVEGWGVSTLRHVDLEPMPKAPAGSDTKLRQRILDLIRSNPATTKTQLAEKWAGKEGPLKASKGAVVAEVESMTVEGVIDFRQPTDEERAARGIKGPTRGIFVIADQNMTLSPPATPPK